jgi:lactobin A/cerein 7B family class IIb bacteriocin
MVQQEVSHSLVGIQELNLNELESVKGGFLPLIPLLIIGAAVICTSSGCATKPKPKLYMEPKEDAAEFGVTVPF